MLALATSAALWWAYFDVVAPVAQRRLGELRGVARNTLARDSFAYLHLPLIAGIELFALGVEQVVGHVDEALVDRGVDGAVRRRGALPAGARRVPLAQRPQPQPAAARGGGAVCAACVPLGAELNAVASLALVTALAVGLIVYETVRA